MVKRINFKYLLVFFTAITLVLFLGFSPWVQSLCICGAPLNMRNIQNMQKEFNLSNVDDDLKKNIDKSDYRVYCLQINAEYGATRTNGSGLGVSDSTYAQEYGCKYICFDESSRDNKQFTDPLFRIVFPYIRKYNENMINRRRDQQNIYPVPPSQHP